jgi:branched-subunit amino acid ABC-type transport system permease component
MGYISVTSLNHPPSLHFAGELWIFAILTVVLLAITICLWLYLDHRRKGRRLRGAPDNNGKAALGRLDGEV